MMRKYWFWIGAVLTVLVAVASLGVNAAQSVRAVPDPAVAAPAVGDDAIEFELGASGIKYAGFVAKVTSEHAKISRGDAIQAARGFAGGLDVGAKSVSAHHVRLTSQNRPGSFGIYLETEGQSAWVVTFKGVPRRPIGSPYTEASAASSTPNDAPNIGNLVVCLDAQTGEYIMMSSLPQK